MKKTTIYLVRHTEVKNPNRIFYVWLPGFNLSKLGFFQARKLKIFFQDKNISKIYTSPLLRTKHTAEIIAGDKIPLSFSKNLIEINYKKWEGLPYDQRPISELEQYIKNPISIDYLGETLLECQERMVRQIMKIVRANLGKKVVIVSHADPIICAKLFFEGKSLNLLNKTSVSNGSITSLEFDDKLQCKEVKYLKISPAKRDEA